MRLVIARCSVDYQGRLSAHLPSAVRLLLAKADGSVSIHADSCGGNIGTPVLSFSPPDGPSFFGPVINKAPKGAEALELWDAVWTLGNNSHFSELKRSTRGRPDFSG